MHPKARIGAPSSPWENCPLSTRPGALSTVSVPGLVGGGRRASPRPLPLAANSSFRPGREGWRRDPEAWLRARSWTPGPWEGGHAGQCGGWRGTDRGRSGAPSSRLAPLSHRAHRLRAAGTGLRCCPLHPGGLQARRCRASCAEEGGGNSARFPRSLGSSLAGPRKDPWYPSEACGLCGARGSGLKEEDAWGTLWGSEGGEGVAGKDRDQTLWGLVHLVWPSGVSPSVSHLPALEFQWSHIQNIDRSSRHVWKALLKRL